MIETVEVKYHQTIYDLPLSKFIDCIVDGNLSALIIHGLPTIEQLSEAWQNILSEYSENVGTQEYRLYVQMYKEVSILSITLNQIRILAHRGGEGIPAGILRMVYDEGLCKELNGLLKTGLHFDWNNQDDYHKNLDKCINRSGSIKIKYDLLNIRFKAIEEKNKGKAGVKMDRQYFISILVTLSDHAKYRIEESITMGEYCERVKRFSDYCESMKNKK